METNKQTIHMGLWLWRFVLLEGNNKDWLKRGEVSGRCGKLLSMLIDCHSLDSAGLSSEGRRSA
jgi:hypothetical protein